MDCKRDQRMLEDVRRLWPDGRADVPKYLYACEDCSERYWDVLYATCPQCYGNGRLVAQ
jgi:hypothetical protein